MKRCIFISFNSYHDYMRQVWLSPLNRWETWGWAMRINLINGAEIVCLHESLSDSKIHASKPWIDNCLVNNVTWKEKSGNLYSNIHNMETKAKITWDLQISKIREFRIQNHRIPSLPAKSMYSVWSTAGSEAFTTSRNSISICWIKMK